ncbi:4Fe-4S dicluster domain-containing protein [Rahnella woolbedingensis]|uniref:4Fe-4S dicluster domain-containing protein n=1 Tax=Rahnella woolbedingensis TaxID=1510574 RepID=A0A419N607_9GAMM|nr:4Fe-4S dicluster domain-containing protein [Rahnella woolbedingensis]RJT42241.1 4Fe-4S dicluster domain-containing protein [Rahnella woolbedingensis]
MSHHFIHADPEKCISCRTCEIACALAHIDGAHPTLNGSNFSPRLQVVKTPKVSVPVMCRQCDDAPCARVCPHDAIVQGKHGLDVIQSRCIGCKSCVVACPFGAINVVVHEPADTGHQAMPDCETHKCDLCSHLSGGPACIAVCPTAALRLVTGADLEKQIHEKRLRTAREDAAIRHF